VKRLFWLAFGAGLGVVTARQISRKAEAFTPSAISSSVTSSVGSLADAVRDFAEDVREGMRQREQELRAGTGLDGTLGARPEDFE
jgi:hypothetical protein